MTWYPMALLPPQIENTAGVPYSGAVLKAYRAETTTVIPMATGGDGATTATSFALNAAGYPVSGGMVIIPHIQEDYKLALYPNQAAADSNTGAVWTVDVIQIANASNDPFYQDFSGDGVLTDFVLSEDLGTDERTIYVFADKKFGEYATNGGYATDSGWTKGAGWTIAGGVAVATGAISTDLSQSAALPLILGESYTITYTVTRSAGGIIPKIGGVAGTERTSAGTYTETIIAGSTQALTFTGNGFTGTIDNVSVHRTTAARREVLRPDEFTINGVNLHINEAPAAGTKNIMVTAPTRLFGALGSIADAAAISEANALAYSNIAKAAAGFAYIYDTDTTASDPGTGILRFDNATLASATKLYVSETTNLSQAIAAVIATWDDSTSTIHGELRMFKQGDPAVFAIFAVIGTNVDNGTWDTVSVAYVGGSGSFTDNDVVTIQFVRNGDKGDTGATGATGGSYPVAVAAGTVDAITADFTPDVTVADQTIVCVISAGTNTSATPTLSTDGNTARTIKKKGGVALVAGDIGAAGAVHFYMYKASGTYYELINPCKTTEDDMVLADNTTNNATTTRHGLLKKLSNLAKEFMDGQGNWNNPALVSTLDGYTSGAGTVASTDTILQAIQKLNGNIAAGSGGLTTIASGNLSTGGLAAIDITSIPQTYKGLILYINDASNTVATRALRVSVDTGLGLGNAENGATFRQIANTTVSAVNAVVGRLWTDVTQTAAQVTSARIEFPGYQSGPIKKFDAVAETASAAGGSWGTASNQTWSTGVLTSVTTQIPRTGGIVGIRITWDNVASGVFDGGTYSLLGVS